MSLSDITFRKFIKTYDISDYEVLTEDGFKDISNLNITIPYDVYQITLENGLSLECADTHIIIDHNGNEVYAINSLGIDIQTLYGNSKVVAIKKIRDAENMYDLTVNSESHTYYTNNILSHNTTTVSSYIVWCLCFKKDFNIGIVANTNSLTSEIVNMCKQMFELIPAFLKPGVKVWNAQSLTLDNGNRILSAVAGGSALRGRTLNFLMVDEVGFIDETKIKAFFDSVMPALSSGTKTKIVLISTPKGFNTFYNLYKDAEAGKNGYVTFEGTWRVVPGRDENWKLNEIKKDGVDVFLQNHEVAWLGSSKTLLSKECLSVLPSFKQLPIGSLDWIHEDFKVYHHPIQESDDEIFYSVGVDSAKISPTANRNSDYVSVQVTEFNKTQKTIRQAATLRTRDMHYLELAEILYETAMYYNNALVLVENNSEGQGIVDTLFDKYEYENIYSSETRNDIMGFRTTPKSKRIGLSNLKKLIENEILKLYDIDTIDEFFTFVKIGSTFKANSPEAHDDAIMALVACIQFLVDEMNETELTLWDFIMDKVDTLDKDEDGEVNSRDDLDIVLSSRLGTASEDMRWLLGA